jgi:hypothetical protein
MKALSAVALSAGVVALSVISFSSFVGQAQAPAPQGQGRGQQPAPPPPPQAAHPSGQAVICGDVALFNNPTDPDNGRGNSLHRV